MRMCYYRAIVEVGKELGRKLLTGSFNLINLSMPVKMFESRSYLQKLADVWVYPRWTHTSQLRHIWCLCSTTANTCSDDPFCKF